MRRNERKREIISAEYLNVLINNLKMAAGSGRWKKLLKYGSLAGVGLLGAGSFVYLTAVVNNEKRKEQQRSLLASKGFNKRPSAPLPSRAEQLKSLGKKPPVLLNNPPLIISPPATEEFDVLVIGGGATGAGCAVDASSRGLKTALVELDDFASGTSSRSTKLIHGGVRYLQKAIMGLDLEKAGNLGATHSGISTKDGSIMQLEVNNSGLSAGDTVMIFLVYDGLLSIKDGHCEVFE